MRTDIKLILIGLVAILAFALVTHLAVLYEPARSSESVGGSWSCTADTFICPNGKEVNRVPPYCLFADCSVE